MPVCMVVEERKNVCVLRAARVGAKKVTSWLDTLLRTGLAAAWYLSGCKSMNASTDSGNTCSDMAANFFSGRRCLFWETNKSYNAFAPKGVGLVPCAMSMVDTMVLIVMASGKYKPIWWQSLTMSMHRSSSEQLGSHCLCHTASVM